MTFLSQTTNLGRLGIFFAGVALAATPTAYADADADLVAALTEFNRHSVYRIPVPTPEQRAALASGEILKVIQTSEDSHGARRAVGLLLTPAGRDEVWVSCQDAHFVQSEAIQEARVGSQSGHKLWYGFLDLPRPFSDRHWVVEVWNNEALAGATENRAWEHAWRLVPGGVAKAKDAVAAGKVKKTTVDMWESAIETPINEGAWLAVALPDGRTLFGYHAATHVGGNIPENLMLQYVKATLDTTLRTIEKRARNGIVAHYGAGHSGVEGGNGAAVTPFGN